MWNEKLTQLSHQLDGDLYWDKLVREMYATDASVYKEIPLAVAIPKNDNDLKVLIKFASENDTHIIPRTAGTSLAGQVVGNGIVVDVSKHFNKILEVNSTENWVRVQPGVIRDELNLFLKEHQLFFGPNTSTSNRCMIGGMVGNNSAGSTSIEYGSTRDHVLEIKAILSDGSETNFGSLSQTEYEEKLSLQNIEGNIYRCFDQILSNEQNREEIKNQFPKPNIHRRNTGYALDILANSAPYNTSGNEINICNLLCGSEGTLALTTEIKLHVDPLPSPHSVLVAAHFYSIQDSLKATQIAMQFNPSACELMDKIILDCTKDNAQQNENRFFVNGDPAAILIIEIKRDQVEDAIQKCDEIIKALKAHNLGYDYPKITGFETDQVWELRKAGLGLLANIPGDEKTVACIEDTAVDLADLPAYIADFTALMDSHKQKSVYYAHAGAGEIHLRPILNLKKSEDVKKFYDITNSVADLVKKYNGSLSGEHGDGRVRSPFIEKMVGSKNYAFFQAIKKTWDPKGIFNLGKIVDAQPMTASLRYHADTPKKTLPTKFNFNESEGIIRMAEKCNGSGDCRKSHLSKGTMCPSYQATRNEKDTTRARANILSAYLSDQESTGYDHKEIKDVLDLCLSCKACATECPSNVDVSIMKAEFNYQYQKLNGIPLRARLFANYGTLNKWGSTMPGLTNFLLRNPLTGDAFKGLFKIAKQRSLPALDKTTLLRWYKKHYVHNAKKSAKKVYLFCDEFTNYGDSSIGIKAIQLLSSLGYSVNMIEHEESGRAHISKGMLNEAQRMAQKNVTIFHKLISKDCPLLGIEPSAILSFRDEYPKLVAEADRAKAKSLSNNVLLIDEFLASEIRSGNITRDAFTKNKQEILLHGHCHQKSLSKITDTKELLSLPENYSVKIIPSGCCGMAGSFGYEKEHYDLSMQIGELTLFPAIRAARKNTVIAAPGTSCRHQIKDGVNRKSFHPVEILHNALIKK